ncbi:MAG: hypothetical protein JXL85_06430 [Bacilli bacterium]|nr:hypothetical protein [Bacilli bacterium]
MKIIGYQGIEGSNSEEAARIWAENHLQEEYILLPLVSSLNVLTCVETEKVDFGVIAIRNNHGGVVKESMDALLNTPLKRTGSITIPIYHHLYVKDDTVTIDQIRFVVSHPQAFLQCEGTLKTKYGRLELVIDEDTATAARKLGNGILSKESAVLCRENAGKMNHLVLLESHLEDNENNQTEFEVYSLQ